MAPRPGRSRKLAEILLASFVIFLVICLWAYWQRDRIAGHIEARIKRRLIQGAIDRIQPKLPFKIESWQIDADWKDLRAGKIPRVALVLSREPYRAHLEGPLDFTQGRSWSGVYSPKIQLDGPIQAKDLRARIEADYSSSAGKISTAKVAASASALSHPVLGFDLTSWELGANWSEAASTISVSTRASRAGWKGGTEGSHAVELTQPSLTWSGPFRIDPPESGSALDGDHVLGFRAKGSEILAGPSYFDLPLSHYPVEARIHWNRGPESMEAETRGQKLRVDRAAGGAMASWDLRSLSLVDLSKTLSGVPALAWMSTLKWQSGRLSSRGSTRLGPSLEGMLRNASGTFTLRGGAFRWNEKYLAARGLNLSVSLPLASATGSTAEVGIARLYYRKFGASLAPFRLRLKSDTAAAIHITSAHPPGLKIDGIPLVLGMLDAEWRAGALTWATSTQLPATPVERVAAGFCVKSTDLPPALLQIDFPKVRVDGDTIVPEGYIVLKVFGGSVRIGDIAFYEFLSEVPQLDFSADWDLISLEHFGKWLGFGEMDGRLVGYARDVTFQSWLPTNFDILTQAKNQNRGDIVFSPEAMRNFIRLFAGEDVEQYMPGIARWLAFGWPSRVFGGYDIDYLGIRAFSAEGSILVETLDPPDPRAPADRPRYILYGSRFRMPLKSARYPLVIDAPAMGNFVRQVIKQLDTIMKSKKKETPDEIEPPCLPPESL